MVPTRSAGPLQQGSPEHSRRAQGRPSRRAVRNFYERALSEAERLDLPEAQAVEGLDQEIAILRVRLKRALQDHPEDMDLIGNGLDLLVKAVAARYRLSPKARLQLTEHLEGVFQHLSQTFLPPEDNHGP